MIGHDFVDADHGYVEWRQRRAHAAVALVADDHQRARFSHHEVGAGDPHVSRQKCLAQPGAGDGRKLDRLGRRIHPQFFAEEIGNVLLGQVDGRGNDVGRRHAGKLNDVLTEVGFKRLDARSDQRMVQADLLGRHAFHLHSAPHAVRPGDLQHNAVGFLPVSRPMDVAAGLSDTLFQQGQIVIKMGDGVETQVVPGLAELLPPRVAENAHDTRARAQQTAGGPLDRGRYLRLDGLGVGAEVDGGGQLMHRSTPSCQDLDQAHRLDRGADPLQTAGNIHQAPGLADHHVFGAGGLDIA